MHPHFARFQKLAELTHGANTVDQALIDFHQNKISSVIKGRNVIAGYVRGWGLQFNIIRSFVQQDPIYIESLNLVKELCLTHEVSLMNIFLIMKYGLKNLELFKYCCSRCSARNEEHSTAVYSDTRGHEHRSDTAMRDSSNIKNALEGDIIEFGSYRGGSAIFIANVAKKLGITGTVYALDTFTGLPAADPTLDFLTSNDFKNASFESLSERISKLGLTNLIPIKGPFQETTSNLLKCSQKILLSYLDCKTYESTRCALSAVLPHMHAQGGYLLLHDPIHSNGLGPFQAMEEMIETHQLYAEQAYPHMVYRYPPLQSNE